MGDNAKDRTTELRREAGALLAQAEARLEKARHLDSTSRRGRRRQVDTLGRRWYGHLWVVKAVIVGATVWTWQVIRRPSVAVAGGVGGVGALAMPSVLYAPAPAVPPVPPPVVADMPSHEPPERVVTVEVEPDGEDAQLVARVEPDPEPTVQPEPSVTYIEIEPTQAPQEHRPEPEPEVAVTLEPTAEPTEPVLDIDLEELCVSVGLPPTASASACLGKLDVGR